MHKRFGTINNNPTRHFCSLYTSQLRPKHFIFSLEFLAKTKTDFALALLLSLQVRFQSYPCNLSTGCKVKKKAAESEAGCLTWSFWLAKWNFCSNLNSNIICLLQLRWKGHIGFHNTWIKILSSLCWCYNLYFFQTVSLTDL